MTEKIYGEAAYQAIQNGAAVSSVLSRLVRILKGRGHTGLYPKILKFLLTQVESHERTHTATVILAQKRDISRFKNDIEAFTKEIGVRDVTMREDASLIGGYLLRGGGVELDRSHKRALQSIYQSLIT